MVKLTAVTFQTPPLPVIVVRPADAAAARCTALRVAHRVPAKPCRPGSDKPGFCLAGRGAALLLQLLPPPVHVSYHSITLSQGRDTQLLGQPHCCSTGCCCVTAMHWCCCPLLLLLSSWPVLLRLLRCFSCQLLLCCCHQLLALHHQQPRPYRLQHPGHQLDQRLQLPVAPDVSKHNIARRGAGLQDAGACARPYCNCCTNCCTTAHSTSTAAAAA